MTHELSKPLGNQYEYARFGASLALSGRHLAVGANYEGGSIGAVYLYQVYNVTDWVYKGVLSSVGGLDTFFGYSLAMDNGTLVVGAPGWRPDLWHPVRQITGQSKGYT